MISGTATQAIAHGRERRRLNSTKGYTCTSNTERADNEWMDPSRSLSTRSAFISGFNSEEDRHILNDFTDVVFGIVHKHHERLLGTSLTRATYKKGKSKPKYKHQGLNFRTLFLSCSNQHGSLEVSNPSLFDQDVVFVDVSRISAADILTTH